MNATRERRPFDRRAAGHRRVLHDEAMHERLMRLPVRCEELLLVYPRAELEERAEILLADLPYATVMTLAIRVRVVRDVIAALPANFSRWA